MLIEVIVGVIGRPHGIKGEVAVEPRTDTPQQRFVAGAVLRAEAGPARFTVRGVRRHADRWLVTFDELTDRTTAEAARGTVLVTDVPADEPTDDGEYFDRQLLGLRVLDASGTERGTVRHVLHLPAQDVLEVDTPAGIRLVPFVAALVPRVDIDAGSLTLADVPGLLTEAGDR